ncbi:MAG: lipoate--protein ligase family protein [Armatimonadota bacterium]
MSNLKHWRLLDSGPADGAWNMAVDEAMLEAGVAGLLVPTLRFYAWQPAAVSLGYFQPLDQAISLEEIERRGFGLVRRPSGGRAILHKDELTYSVTVPDTEVADGKSVMGSYRSISRGIESGLSLLGVGAHLAERKDEERMKAKGLPTVCFAKAAKCDMTVQGRKIVGSAQTRRRGIIMQHGSVPIHIDPEEHLAVMPGDGVDEASKAKLMEAACGVADALGHPISYDELAAALAQGFAQRLGLELEPGELTEWELAKARELKETKYTTDDWNRKPGKREEA